LSLHYPRKYATQSLSEVNLVEAQLLVKIDVWPN